jgi:hypothetical protein
VSGRTSGYGPDPPGVRRPSLGGRVALAVVLLVPLLALTVGLPTYALGELHVAGATSLISSVQVVVGGVVLSALWALAFVLRPTRLYGAAGMARATATSLYFVLLAPFASVTFPLPHGILGTIQYGELLVAFAIVPVFGFVGSLFVLVSDRHNLDTRLRLEYPERWLGTRPEYVDPATVARSRDRSGSR